MDSLVTEAALDPSVSAALYRDGMAAVAGHVHVVTTEGAAGRSGFTAIAVASVSDNPPTMLVCLNRASSNGPLIEENRIFAINALGAGSAELAEVFAGRAGVAGEARFAAGDWGRLVTGAPVLDGALVSFDCRLLEMRAFATHYIVMGRVVAVRMGADGPGLTYFRRGYRPITS